jgi:glutamate-5-semialdehyde dehydrogenase
MNSPDIKILMTEIGKKAKISAEVLACSDPMEKQQALVRAAESISDNKEKILSENFKDIQKAKSNGLSDAMIDRLLLDDIRVEGISKTLNSIATLKDPIGQIISEWNQPSGLNIKRVQTPLGVIGVIYESRPNVTADAGGLCFKSGNAVILRGGSESSHSSKAIHSCLVNGLQSSGFPAEAIQLVPTTSREAVSEMLSMTDYIDVIVPRGGKSLVKVVQEQAKVPVFAHLEGIVHIYIDKDASLEKTLKIVLNSKTRRTGICGAVECLIFHRDIVSTIGKDVLSLLMARGVRVNADKALSSLKGTNPAKDEHWGKEYLDMEISALVVDGIDQAMKHIKTFGSNHTDCIVTEDEKSAQTFLNGLDSAIVMHNVSTQFADGGEFGMGAEIGISTGKMHARGPVGVNQLTSFKYIVSGDGIIRT